MQIINGQVYIDTFHFEPRNISISDQLFNTLSSSFDIQEDFIIDATDCYIIPGLIDIHLHGACGYDFCDASFKAINHITKYELYQGITSLFPTTMTLDSPKLLKILKTLYQYHLTATSSDASIEGIHLEGPYISPIQCGAQNPSYCKSPSLDEFKSFQDVAPHMIRYITLAPEQQGALDFIRAISPDVICSIGHTNADYDTTLAAFHAGASHLTHFYNAMPPFHHRNPGVIGATFDYSSPYIELICDGLHLHPATIRHTFDSINSDYIILVSDSTMATGLEDGHYTLGGSPIHVLNGEARTPNGQLAGSTTHLMDCLRKVVSFGIPFETALKCVTANPARESGIYHRVGSITPGKQADCVILDQEMHIRHVIKSGKLIY